MLKSSPVTKLLDSLVNSDKGTILASLLSSENGSPLLSSISTHKQFHIKFPTNMYSDYLQQFTSIDINKVDSSKEDEKVTAGLFEGAGDPHAELEAVSQYLFTCYNAFQNDYKAYLQYQAGKENGGQENPVESQDDSVNWFFMKLEDNNIFLHSLEPKSPDDTGLLLLMITDSGYPKGFAKEKIKKFEAMMEEGGF